MFTFVVLALLGFCLADDANIRTGPDTVDQSFVTVGDMVMTQTKYDKTFKPSKTRYTTIALDDRWTNGKVPYVYEASISAADRTTIRGGLNIIEQTTCLKFTERASEANYLSFFDGGSGACWSNLGMIGGKQQLSLGSGCVSDPYVIHEVFHAMGFMHEQMRPDRDEYITVAWDNITTDGQSQYKMSTADMQSEMAYGYNGIMHYESWAFQKASGLKTMFSKDPQYQAQLDESLHLYHKCDSERVNVLYNCTEKITRDPECYKGGVVPPPATTAAGGSGGASTTAGYDYYYYYYETK